uniref:Uncharacterized protein n=1 Tax=Timema poppense TaxID=170557 RepID=A0A7R9DKV5_TIMPO|nr:unnamed protein product [Timema poppensis]
MAEQKMELYCNSSTAQRYSNRGGGVMLVQSPTSTGGHMVYRVTLDCRKQGSLLPPLHYYDPNTYEDTVRTSFPHPPTDEISPTKHLKGMIVRTLVKRSPRPPPIISRDYAPKLSLRIAHSSFFPPFVSSNSRNIPNHLRVTGFDDFI